MNPFADNSNDDFASYDFEGSSRNVDTSGFGTWDIEQDNERNSAVHLQRQIEEKQKNIIDSSNRSLGLVYESEDIGNETAHELVRQGEQLRRTEQKLDKIDSDLNTSQRHITSLKSMFGGIRNYFSRKNDAPEPIPETRDSRLKTYLERGQSDNAGDEERKKERMENHPGMRNLPYNKQNQHNSQQSSMAAFESQLDNNLDELSSGLSRLRGLAEGLSYELEDQNEDIERLTGKAGKVDQKIEKTNTDVKRLLRR